MSLAPDRLGHRRWGAGIGAPEARPVHDLVAEQVRRVPDRTAIRSGNESVTYAEVESRSNRLANHLRSLGVGRGALVGVCLSRTVDLPIALLAVMKSGAGYVPLDPAYPPERLEYMASDAGLSALVTTQALRSVARWPAMGEVCIDGDREAILSASAEDPDAGVMSDDCVYVLYTSGSTGRPKGVQVGHRSLVNLLRSVQHAPGFDETDILLATTTVSFGPHAVQMLLPLVTGARVVLASRETVLEAGLLAELLRTSRATVMSATPSIWDFLMRGGWEGDSRLKALYGGEPMPEEVVSRLLERCGSLWNCYGSTETTIWATCGRVRTAEDARYLGDPVRNTRLVIADEQQGAVPPGVEGELLIGGAGLALGYLGRPELTAERFIVDPLGTGQRLYRTGDLVRREEDGRLRLLGRIDDQVKVRGFRIEPGEIEHQLASQPGVERAVVVARGEAEHRRLVAYLVGTQMPPAQELRAALRGCLPEYMVPASYIVLERLPTTPNGKIDRSALPEPAAEGARAPASATAPATRLELELMDLWSRLLGTGRFGPGDDFFDLGGHSLLAVRMLGEVAAATGVRPSVGRFLTDPTIAGLAAAVQEAAADLGEPVVVEAGDPTGSPLFLLYTDVITLPSMRRLAPLLPGHRLWGLTQGRPTREFDRSQRVEDIAAELVPLIVERQPEGPVTLGGHSFGGILAYEVGRQLEQAGRSLALVVLLDTLTPALFRLNMLLKVLRAPARLRDQRWRRRRSREVTAMAGRVLSGRTAGKPPPVRLNQDELDVEGVNTIQMRYRPRGISAPLLILTSTGSTPTLPYHPPLLGWRRLHRGPLAQSWVPGDHLSMLLEPNVAATAAALRDGLARGFAR